MNKYCNWQLVAIDTCAREYKVGGGAMWEWGGRRDPTHTSRKHGKQEPPSFVQYVSSNHLDLHSPNDCGLLFFCFTTST